MNVEIPASTPHLKNFIKSAERSINYVVPIHANDRKSFINISVLRGGLCQAMRYQRSCPWTLI